MYTDSIKSEREFIVKLYESHSTSMVDGETTTVCECPKCHNGTVETRCSVGTDHGHKWWSFEHICNTCGEKFVIGQMRSDIFFNEPYTMLEKIETPFGDIQVKINGQVVPFRCRTDTYDSEEKPIEMRIIDIDLSGCKSGDLLFCGFEKKLLEYNDSDERSTMSSCENDELLLALCAYEPEELEYYCYELDGCDGKGYCYRITKNPEDFDAKAFYESKILSLAVAWVRKEDYVNADTEIFLALTCVIG